MNLTKCKFLNTTKLLRLPFEKDCRSCHLRSCALGRQRTARLSSLSKSRTGCSCSSVITWDETHWLELARMQWQPPLTISCINWVCLAHLGHTAVVVQSLDHHPSSQDRGHAGDQQWQRSHHGLREDERYHAPCPDCGHAEGRARDASPPAASWCMGLKAHSFASSPAWTGASCLITSLRMDGPHGSACLKPQMYYICLGFN